MNMNLEIINRFSNSKLKLFILILLFIFSSNSALSDSIMKSCTKIAEENKWKISYKKPNHSDFKTKNKKYFFEDDQQIAYLVFKGRGEIQSEINDFCSLTRDGSKTRVAEDTFFDSITQTWGFKNVNQSSSIFKLNCNGKKFILSTAWLDNRNYNNKLSAVSSLFTRYNPDFHFVDKSGQLWKANLKKVDYFYACTMNANNDNVYPHQEHRRILFSAERDDIKYFFLGQKTRFVDFIKPNF